MPVTADRGGLVVALRIAPGARQDEIQGLATDRQGRARLKIRVRAAPAKGAANATLLKFLASRWDVPSSSLTITAGAGARDKMLQITGGGPELAARIGRDIPGGTI